MPTETPSVGTRHPGSLPAVTRVLSCIQPTGEVHLGNYLGALRNWVSGQHENDAFHGIVDLHALTITEGPDTLGTATMELAAMLFAVGLDPAQLRAALTPIGSSTSSGPVSTGFASSSRPPSSCRAT